MVLREEVKNATNIDWNDAEIIVIDAPLCLGNIRDRMSFAKHRLEELRSDYHKFLRFERYDQIHDILQVTEWIKNKHKMERGLLIMRSFMAGYIRGKTSSALSLKVNKY
jgi:hypothetical protein